MKKGQLHLEAVISVLFLAGILGAAMGTLEQRKTFFLQEENILDAEAEAQKCAILVNSLFSNTGSEFREIFAGCFSEKEFEIKSSKGEKTKTAFTIAKNMKTTKIRGENFLEAKTSAHYR